MREEGSKRQHLSETDILDQALADALGGAGNHRCTADRSWEISHLLQEAEERCDGGGFADRL